ncbi:MAG: nucleotidyltransferase family protein [Coriobacteriales bacterium]|jgi:molybdenum cofactor cytidylyltransferase
MGGSRVAAVIVAAGRSSRMGDFKPMLPLGKSTIVRVLIESCIDSGAETIVLVTGRDAEKLEEHVADYPVKCVRNPHYETTPMSQSVRIGLEALPNDCERVLFSPVDVPLWLPSTARKLLASDSSIAVPTCNGRRGHPLMLDASIIPDLLDNLEPGGLKAALEKVGVPIDFIDVEDEGCLYDADTPEQYERLLDLEKKRRNEA